MRELYPKKQRTVLQERGKSFLLTEEDYRAILEAIDENREAIASEADTREDAIEALNTRISGILENANIDKVIARDLTASILKAVDITSESLTVDSLTVVVDSVLESAYIKSLRSDSAIVSELQATNVTGSTAEFAEINATIIHTDGYNPENASITNLTADQSVLNETQIANATIEQEEVAESNIENATIENASITEAEITDLKARNILNEFRNHNDEFNRQFIGDDSVGADGDYWIVLPKFVNGEYDLIATTNTDSENGEVLWSMEIANSSRNICFKWSTNKVRPWIEDVEIIEDATDNKSFIQIHCKTYSQALYLWHHSGNFDIKEAPQVYSTKQYEGKGFTINRDAGLYLNNTTFAGEFHADKLLIDSVEFESVYILKNLFLTTQYDQYGASLGTTRGLAGQYITNTEDEYGNEGIQWVDPKETVEYDDKKRLITSDAVAKYDGKVANTETPETPEDYDYNIKHLGDNSEVHGSLKVDDTLEVTEQAKLPNFYNGPEADLPADLPDNSIVVFTEVDDDSDYTADRLYRKDIVDSAVVLTEIVSTKDLADQKPVVYNQEDNTLTTSETLSIDALEADRIVVDDLTVNGTAHINNQEEDTVVGDFLTLRANNNSPLTAGQYSGVLVNNFQVGEVCAIVVDYNGIARVGHATGTNTTYTDLYFHDGHYYTDATLETEVEPAGVMLSWSDYEITENYEHWTNAVWTVLSFDSTQPLLTRKEESQLNDQGILKYNTDTHQADTLPVPTKSEQTLEAHIVEEAGETTISYRWKDKQAGTYVFQTMIDYEAVADSIPVGSQIIIEDETDYVYGDEING